MDGYDVNPDSIYDIQVKRLHEYKRQLLNAFSIMTIYFRLKDKKLKNWTPTTFIFGAKAAPGYARAKAIIKYINEIAKLVNNDPETKDLLQVYFISNYNVSYAEKIVVAADLSEQTSTAGLEASGTGNMKFMLTVLLHSVHLTVLMLKSLSAQALRTSTSSAQRLRISRE